MSANAVESRASRSPYWNGMLCVDTRQEIADRMADVLMGHHFTLVIGNSYSEESTRFLAIEVYPSQWLMGEIRSDLTDYAYIGWNTPRLSMGIHTRAATQAEGRAQTPHDYAHFTFEPGRVVIDHYAPAGYRLQWIFAVEHHDPEFGPTCESGATP